jgi:hypothetical protein
MNGSPEQTERRSVLPRPIDLTTRFNLSNPRRRFVGEWGKPTFTAVVFLSLAILMAISLRPADRFFGGRPFVEDAYYSLSVARNIATGNGFTIDGRQLTNGVQPLFTIVSALPFALTKSTIAALRIQLALHVFIAIATGVLIAKSVAACDASFSRGNCIEIAVFSLFLLALNLYPTLFNGLETGLLLLAISALIYSDLGKFHSSDRKACLAGLCLGMVVLVRVDTVFLVLIYCLRALAADGAAWNRLRRAMLIGGFGVPHLLTLVGL